MTGALALGLLAVVGVLDGAFAGFRASCGRTGLVDHRAEDRRATRRGLGVFAVGAAAVVAACRQEGLTIV